jgi:SNF2 family DNA or RNA helicase
LLSLLIQNNNMLVIQEFYLRPRQAGLHPYVASHTLELEVKSQDEWERSQKTSAKLEAIISIAQHHLQRDGNSSLQLSAEGELVSDEDSVNSADSLSSPPQSSPSTNYVLDKILIYCTFRKGADIIQQVLSFYGIEALIFNSSLTESKKRQNLNSFRNDPRYRVLIIGNLGIAGLNLACANILIIAVCFY